MDSEKAISALRATVEQAGPAARLNVQVAVTLDQARALLGRDAMLTDAVVMAAALWFEQIDTESERDYASESLHEFATDLVNANPRLKGAFPSDAPTHTKEH